MAYIISSGESSDGIIVNYNSMTVLNGATASTTTVGYDGSMLVSSGGTADNTTVNFGGSMLVSNGGTATQIVENGGYVEAADGAVITYVSNTISDLYLDTNSATVHSGTTANRTVLERNLDLWYDAFGAMYVYSDGIANGTTALSGGKLHIEKGGKANSTVLSGGSLFVSEGGTANSTTIYEEGDLNVFDGGIANNTTVNNGLFAVLSGGTANSITVNDGSFAVLSGGTANATTIFGGSLLVSSGGTATDVVWTPCEGRVEVDKGAVVTFASQYSGVYYGSRNQLLSNAAVMENMMLTPLCEMFVMTGGTANNITASSFSGWDMDMVPIYVSSGGAVNDTTLINGGRLYVYSDAEANGTLVQGDASLIIFNGGITNNTTVNQYGYFIINSGGSADGITVNPGGALIIRSGGTATDVVWTPCEGRVTFEDGAHVTFTSQYSGVYYGRVDYFEVTLSSAVVMNDVTVARTNEEMYVMSGGTAVNTTVSGVLSELMDDIFDKDNLGSMYVCSGGTAVNTHAVHGGNIVISSGGIANDTTVTAAFLTVLSGGTANGITVESASYPFDVSEEEFVSCFGSVFVSSGGTVNGATVKRGCNLSVSSGGKLTGKMKLEAGATVSAYEGATLDFDLTYAVAAAKEALVNNLSVVKGAPVFSLTVDGSQREGTYKLAGGAAGFDGTITVKNTYGADLGTLTLGEKVYIGKDAYSLTLKDDDLLTVTVNAPTITESNGDVLLENTMPQARYMYGCAATTTAMILGYYDLYGYRGLDFSALIEGDVELNPRGSDDVKYKMDDFESNLGKATATMDYVRRFYSKDSIDLINTGKDTETTPAEELEYSFVDTEDGPAIRTDNWNCIADYLGTGQFWRGNDNLDTTCHPGVMMERYLLMDNTITITITDEETGTQRDIAAGYNDLQYGVYLYVRNRGYSLDMKLCKAHMVDTVGGSFTFEDYMKEIDEGRPVYVIIEGHVMVGYGYNTETREIIFDSCYEADERMAWDGTYNFAKKDRTLLAIVTVGLMAADNDTDLAISPFDEESGVTEKLIVATGEDKLVSEDYCFVGSPLYLSFAVSNLGTAASPAFDTSIYFDGELMENIPSMTLDAGTITRQRNVPLVTGFGVGLHTITVRIDPGNEFPETSGLNNSEEVPLMVLKEGTNVVEGTKTVDSGEISEDDYVMNGAEIQVLDGGTAEGTLIQGKVTSQTFNGEVLFTPGLVNVSKGGLVQDATVYEYGKLQVSGTAKDIRVLEEGNAVVFDGGTVSGATVATNGTLEIASGGKLTGELRMESNANVIFEEGSFLDFDLTQSTAGAAALVNDLSIIQGTPACTLTVDGTQATGLYTLAEGAAGLDGVIIIVKDTAGNQLGAFNNPGDKVSVGQAEYTLNLADGVLSVSAVTVDTYDFLINGETLSVQKDFADDAVFDTVTLTTEQLNSFEWTNAEEGVSITVNGIALENGKCGFALTGISKDDKITVQIAQGDETPRMFTINTLNSHLPEIRAEIPEGSLGANTPGDFFLSFINTRTIVKADNAGNILYYRNEDSPDTQYGLWDFKTHQIDGKTYYSYHSTESHPESIVFTGHNPGERVIMDENYNEIARIRAVATEKNKGDTTLDGHEFIMLGEDHYIVMSYLQVEADNIPDVNIYTGAPIDHADKAILVGTYIQEIDHGEVVFDWLSTEHPELYSMTVTDETEGAADFTNTDPEVYVDYVHLNAIVIDDDGNLVVSCRHLNSMIKIDRNGGTGNLMWVLSGVGDEFGLTDDQKTSGQHYLHYLGNGFFSAFNNNNDKGPTDLVLYHLNEDETALAENDGFQCWVVPGTTELTPGIPCLPHDTYACGAFQMLGEYGVAGWGWNISGDELVTEFKLDDASEITFQLRSGYSKEGAYATYRVVKCLSSAPELAFSQQAASWSEIEHSSGYVLSVAHQGTDAALSVGVSGNACDIYNLPNGDYAAAVTENDFGVSSAKSSLKVENNLSPEAVVSPENGIDDLFFAKASGVWNSQYCAKNAGSVNDWTGTWELVQLSGRNRLGDTFTGSTDSNILLLTDDANGDALFVDDIYTALPGASTDQQARIARIDEIRAGAGDDIVDMTSQQFEYAGEGLAIRGGEGNDVIWANKGNNLLFGDAGNDRIVGASGNDVIAGGSGNDSMHGGGGEDIFTFCDNWGADTVEQLESGKVTLWFASGDESKWNPETLTYTDGDNSVTVKGVASVELKFGGTGSDAAMFNTLSDAGAFKDFSSQKIFEESGKGILASL